MFKFKTAEIRRSRHGTHSTIGSSGKGLQEVLFQFLIDHTGIIEQHIIPNINHIHSLLKYVQYDQYEV